MDEEAEKAAAPKVKQVLPADGWHAVFASSSGLMHTARLVCWALVDTTGREDMVEVYPWSEQSVIGMAVIDGYGVQLVCHESGFLGYTESVADLEHFDEAAESYARRMKKQSEKN